MPSLTKNLEPEGAVVEVHFLISTELEKKYIKEKKQIPKPVVVKSVIDTGASHCVIQKDIPAKLGLEPVGVAKMNTPSCKDHECYRYFLRIAIPSHNLIYEGQVTSAPLEGQNIDCLIGRDLLSHGIFIYLGKVNQFTLSF